MNFLPAARLRDSIGICARPKFWYSCAMDIRIIREPISSSELEELAQAYHHRLVKGVVDLEREVVALGGEWHIDANNVLIQDGSEQRSLWGFNLYPQERGDNAIEYISLINIRPAQGNRAMELMDNTLRESIYAIVRKLIPDLGL